jgi:hypothetical protein
MKMKIIEFDERCKSCKGTGIYVGMAEYDGYGVVCHKCNGTGKAHFKYEYEDFEKREINPNIKKVLQVNPGIGVGGIFDFGGMSYNDWYEGKPFPPKSEMRNYVCPNWWLQSTEGKHTDWDWCIRLGESFSQCEHFCNKKTCWERYDEEMENKNEY